MAAVLGVFPSPAAPSSVMLIGCAAGAVVCASKCDATPSSTHANNQNSQILGIRDLSHRGHRGHRAKGGTSLCSVCSLWLTPHGQLVSFGVLIFSRFGPVTFSIRMKSPLNPVRFTFRRDRLRMLLIPI